MRLVICDFDGTASPHVPKAQDARLNVGFEELVNQIVESGDRFTFLTGRNPVFLFNALPEALRSKVDIFGHHGMSSVNENGDLVVSSEHEDFFEATSNLTSQLEAGFPPGLEIIEDKQIGVVLHLRWISPDEAEQVIGFTQKLLESDQEFERMFEAHFSDGILELKPRVDIDKGTCVREIVANIGVDQIDSLSYAGDDTPDIPAFEAADDLRCTHGLYGKNYVVIREGSALDPSADYAKGSKVVPSIEELIMTLASDFTNHQNLARPLGER